MKKIKAKILMKKTLKKRIIDFQIFMLLIQIIAVGVVFIYLLGFKLEEIYNIISEDNDKLLGDEIKEMKRMDQEDIKQEQAY